MALGSFLLVVISSLILIRQESGYVKCSNSQGAKWTDYVNIVNNNNKYNNSSTTTVRQFAKQQSQHMNNQYSLSPGELPGYTGWSRPEQTLAGYFDIDPLSHSPTSNNQAQLLQSKYHSIVKSGDKFSLLLTCNHNNNIGVDNDIDEGPPYECPSNGGTLFYVRAYGPAVITGLVTDFQNASYSIEMQFIDPGEYFLEVVATFSVPLDYDEFPLLDDDIFEPGYEGYMVGDFPITILVTPSVVMQDDSSLPSDEKDKPWCTISQLTETSPQSALYKGHWQVIDTVARLSHKPLTPDETQVSLDGYRMGLNSVGVRMSFEYEQCDLIHIRDIAGGLNGGLDKCLNDHLGFHIPQVSENSTQGDWESNELPDRAMISGDGAPTNQTNVYDENNFEGVHVIFIGDSVMRLVRYFFLRLVGGSIGFKVTLIETNGGIHATMSNVTSTLEAIRKREEGKRIKRAILFNSGLHDIDILCSSKRKSTREKIDVIGGKSCEDSYREAMTQLVHVLNEYPAILKVFRSTTAGKRCQLPLVRCEEIELICLL